MENSEESAAEGPAGDTREAAGPAPVLPGYTVDRLLGVGGSAAVWLVRSHAGEQFALKVVRDGGERTPNAFELRREANVLARLKHPNLLQLHTVAETDRGAGLLSTYAPGGSVAALVAARGPVAPGEAVSILVGLAAALGYLHGRGAAHGDISPGNILFAADGKPLLGDFGQARLLGAPGEERLGTPGYEAPENAGPGVAALGTAGDIFALSAVGWFLLTGKAPPAFRERPPLSILVPGIGRLLPALLEAGLSEDPGQRPSAEEFAAAAYRSTPALPVDLAASVHPEVLPELLTRRTRSAAEPGRRRFGRRRRNRRERSDRGAVRRVAGIRPRATARAGRGGRGIIKPVPAVATALVLSVLVLAGIALAAPEVLRPSAGEPMSGSRQDPQAPGNAPGQAPAADSGSSRPSGTGELPPQAPSSGPKLDPGTGDPVGARSVEALLAEASADDPAQALPALAELRARAFASADPKLLNHVNAPGSEALREDRQQIARLARDGHTLSGLAMRTAVLGAADIGDGQEPESGEPGESAGLTVRLEVSAYDQVDGAGTVVHQAAATQQQVELLLQRSGGAWKISRILAADPGMVLHGQGGAER